MNFKEIKTEILPYGFLKVMAAEMINHLPAERISGQYEVDPRGYMRISMNVLLVDTGGQVVLFDPGCADFLSARLKAEYGLELHESMDELLNQAGYTAEQVTDVIFTHLHFDHGSGAFKRIPGNIVKRFPEADYHVLNAHFKHASGRIQRESHSFFATFFRYVDQIRWLEEWNCSWMDFRVFNGHTRGMVVPRILTGEGEIYYVSDLIPMEIFLDLHSSSGYDLEPELARKEKMDFLGGLDHPCKLVFFHDPVRQSVVYPPVS